MTETMNILLKYYNTLYSKPQFGVEDICFFEETKLIFGSVSHVSSAHLFLSSSNDLLLYRQIANWKEENFPECDSVSIPKQFLNFNSDK